MVEEQKLFRLVVCQENEYYVKADNIEDAMNKLRRKIGYVYFSYGKQIDNVIE